MKFTASLSTLLLLLPLLAQQVAATPLGFQSGVAVGKNAAPAPAKGAASSAKAVATKAATTAKAAASTAPAAASSVAAGNGKAAASSSAAAPAASSSAPAQQSSQDPQSSLTLDPRVIAKGFENNGQDVPTAGQVASLTSSNNFINFCLTVPNLPISNGLQVKTGSCNPAPMGVIAATTNMPSSKFQFPKNGDVIQANTAFTISMAISHLETGFFVNANENYFSAPQFVNGAGDIQGHSHVVVELLSSEQQTNPTNPNVFAFFKGLNDKANNGVLTADVTNGLPAGTYRLASINSAANHQPVLVAVAQHGSLDDQVYFTVTDNGQGSGSGAAASSSAAAASATAKGNGAAASASVAATSAKASATVGLKGNNTGNNGNQAPAKAAPPAKAPAKAPTPQKGNNRNAGFGNQRGNNNAAQFPGHNGFFGGFKVKRNALNRADVN